MIIPHVINSSMSRLKVGFLLAVPGILATLAFAPIIIHLFYSTSFIAAHEILRWQMLGILLRVAIWPMGFAIIAKGKMKLYFWTELLANAVLLGLTWMGIVYFGLVGIGMAFFGMYIFYGFLIFVVVKRMSGFSWSKVNIRLGLFTIPIVIIYFSAKYFITDLWYMILGGALTLAFGGYSIKCLLQMTDVDGTTSIFYKLKKRLGFGCF